MNITLGGGPPQGNYPESRPYCGVDNRGMIYFGFAIPEYGSINYCTFMKGSFSWETPVLHVDNDETNPNVFQRYISVSVAASFDGDPCPPSNVQEPNTALPYIDPEQRNGGYGDIIKYYH